MENLYVQELSVSFDGFKALDIDIFEVQQNECCYYHGFASPILSIQPLGRRTFQPEHLQSKWSLPCSHLSVAGTFSNSMSPPWSFDFRRKISFHLMF